MRFSDAHLQTLVAIVEHGTFEAAADALHVTPSAASQRMRALESQVGQVLVIRSTPCQPTPAAATLLRLARQQDLLLGEALSALGQATATRQITLAINADSLATWFVPVLNAAAGWDDITLQLRLEDETHTATWLRNGSVLAAITAEPVAVQGCSVQRLGSMHYLPVVAPALLQRYRSQDRIRWSELPVVRFGAKDKLQEKILRAHHAIPRMHDVPSAEGFLAAVRTGLGWGCVPSAQAEAALDRGEVVRLPGTDPVQVTLHWQAWRLQSSTLERVGAAVRVAAAAMR